ncbi:hypothetical protein LCGC14_2004230, partial [marine sediment metagenome]
DLADLAGEYDLVILDCGSGIGPEVTDFCELADQVVVVTTPEPTALTDAYGMIKSLALRQLAGRVSILVNFAADRNEAKATHARIAAVAKQFLGRTVYEGGYLLTDPKVPAAVRQRRPFVLAYPWCPASRCLTTLAVKLRPRGIAHKATQKGGFLSRVLKWLD